MKRQPFDKKEKGTLVVTEGLRSADCPLVTFKVIQPFVESAKPEVLHRSN